MVELLLAEPEAPVYVRCCEGETPIFLACSANCDSRIVSALLDAGSDPTVENNEQQSPLHVVSDIKLAKLLITSGADVNASDFNKYTPLHSAVEKNNADLVDLLLNAGADTSLRELNGLNPLMLSFQHHFRAVRRLLDCTKDMNTLANDGWSALMLAINAGAIEVALELLRRGAAVDVYAENLTALHLAVMRQEEELFRRLWASVTRNMYNKLHSLPHLMLIHRWYTGKERIQLLLHILENHELFFEQKDQRSFLHFMFCFERDNKLELVLCDIFRRVAIPRTIPTSLLLRFIENYSSCACKHELLEILIERINDWEDRIIARQAIELDPELVPRLLTLTMSFNPSQVLEVLLRKTRTDKAVLRLLLHLFAFCTPTNLRRQLCIDRLAQFNPHSAKRVKYTVSEGDPRVQRRRVVDYEITPRDRDVMCRIHARLRDFVAVPRPKSLREIARDAVRYHVHEAGYSLAQARQHFNALHLPNDIHHIILLRTPVNNL